MHIRNVNLEKTSYKKNEKYFYPKFISYGKRSHIQHELKIY